MTNPHDPNNPYGYDPSQDTSAWGYPGQEHHAQDQYWQQPGSPGMFAPGAPTYQPSLSEARFGSFHATNVLSGAWAAFARAWVPWVISFVLVLVAVVVAVAVMMVAFLGVLALGSGSSSVGEPELGVGIVLTIAAIYLVLLVVTCIFQLNCYRNGLRTARGEHITLGSFFSVSGLMIPLLTLITVGIVVSVAMLFFVVPGLIAAVILIFAGPAAFALRQAGVVDALTASWRIVSANVGQTLLLFLLLIVINWLAAITVVGIVIAAPLMYIAYAYAVQLSIGGPVAQNA